MKRDEIRFTLRFIIACLVLAGPCVYFVKTWHDCFMFISIYFLGLFAQWIVDAIMHDLFLFYDRCKNKIVSFKYYQSLRNRINMFVFFRKLSRAGERGSEAGKKLREAYEKRK